MVKVELEVIINRPIEEVFSFMSNVENDSQWSTGAVETKLTSEGPIGKGSTFEEATMFLGRKIEMTGEYTEYIPNKKFVCKSISGPFPAEGSYTFEEVDGGTKVTATIEVEPRGFFKIAEPLLIRMFKRQSEAELANLKDLLESKT